ncbi:MAG: hypothetical protein Unbinned657contig1001_11 [Prokaryotic dsDNA virus sp.]|jgi:hypothetical protein|nr:MAG: hypothetical protein Unbinned657contig1001_11 [Prokaryotic dsDNA virus sp.]|tara:strand:+ start:169 stop:594 length:426 start_codon:yes stop_codon:yes gene_type:complete
MQTFMTTYDYRTVAKELDYRRLGKQRVEGMQTHNQLTKGKGGYKHHPINAMWKGYESSLAEYTNAMINEWISRGYNNTMELIECCSDYQGILECFHKKPEWVYSESLHLSHKSNLLRKDYDYYSLLYGTNIPIWLPYIWSV